MADRTMMIVTIGYRHFACPMAHAPKLMAALAPLQEVEFPENWLRREWTLSGAGVGDLLRMESGVVVKRPVPPKGRAQSRRPEARPAEQLRLTHQPLAIGHEP